MLRVEHGEHARPVAPFHRCYANAGSVNVVAQAGGKGLVRDHPPPLRPAEGDQLKISVVFQQAGERFAFHTRLCRNLRDCQTALAPHGQGAAKLPHPLRPEAVSPGDSRIGNLDPAEDRIIIGGRHFGGVRPPQATQDMGQRKAVADGLGDGKAELGRRQHTGNGGPVRRLLGVGHGGELPVVDLRASRRPQPFLFG